MMTKDLSKSFIEFLQKLGFPKNIETFEDLNNEIWEASDHCLRFIIHDDYFTGPFIRIDDSGYNIFLNVFKEPIECYTEAENILMKYIDEWVKDRYIIFNTTPKIDKQKLLTMMEYYYRDIHDKESINEWKELYNKISNANRIELI